MGWCAAGFLAGCLAVLLAPGPALPAGLAAIAAAGAVALWCRRVRWLGFFAAAFLLCHLQMVHQLAHRQVDEERLLLDARIVSLPARAGDLLRFDAELRDPRQRRPMQRGRLAWRLAPDSNRAPTLAAGDTWRLALRLSPPRATLNPGAVDVERTLFRDRIHVVAEVIDSPLNRRLAAGPPGVLAVRGALVNWIDAVVADRSAAALIAALTVGATGDVSRGQWRVFNATGITHLVAISGLHVTLFAWLAMRFTGWLWKYAARCGLRVRRDSATACAGVACAAAYALLAGFSVPTQRTLVMLALFLLWRCRARAAPLSGSLASSLVVVLLLDPFAPLGAGLWLSFGAVGAILLTAGTRVCQDSKLREFLRLQLWITVALLPATLAVFGSVSLAGLVVNLVAIPLFTLLLVPVVLGASAMHLALPAAGSFVADGLLRLAAWTIDGVWPMLAAAADSPGAVWRASPDGLEYLLALLGLGVVLCPWPRALRASAVLLLLPLAAPERGPARGELDVSVLDVGQGTAVLLRTQHHGLLYGTGDAGRSRGAPAERVVLPYLAWLGLRSLDAIVLPRTTIDAGAGVTALHGGLRAGSIVAGVGTRPPPPEFTACPGAADWVWDGLRFVLRAAANGSCTLQVSGAHVRVLLAADVDAGSEHALLEQGVDAVHLALVPRHGAANASSHAFIERLAPRWAIASVRASARQSASYLGVAARWRAAGATVLDTASGGALRLRFGADQRAVRVEQARAGRIGVWRLP